MDNIQFMVINVMFLFVVALGLEPTVICYVWFMIISCFIVEIIKSGAV